MPLFCLCNYQNNLNGLIWIDMEWWAQFLFNRLKFGALSEICLLFNIVASCNFWSSWCVWHVLQMGFAGSSPSCGAATSNTYSKLLYIQMHWIQLLVSNLEMGWAGHTATTHVVGARVLPEAPRTRAESGHVRHSQILSVFVSILNWWLFNALNNFAPMETLTCLSPFIPKFAGSQFV